MKEKTKLEHILCGINQRLPDSRLGKTIINLDNNLRDNIRYDFTRGGVGKKTFGDKIFILPLFVAMGVSSYAGSYIGQGLGYVLGNGINLIPYLNDFAPYIAERSGLINDYSQLKDFNENFYETGLGLVGVWKGFWLPLKYLARLAKEERQKLKKEGFLETENGYVHKIINKFNLN